MLRSTRFLIWFLLLQKNIVNCHSTSDNKILPFVILSVPPDQPHLPPPIETIWSTSPSTVDPPKYNPPHRRKGKPLLSELLRDKFYKEYGKFCSVKVLSTGNVHFKKYINETHTEFVNLTLTYPSLLIRCSNNTDSYSYNAVGNNFTEAMKTVAKRISEMGITNDSKFFLQKDNFLDGLIMIAFIQTVICVASWMIFLTLLLIPTSSFHLSSIILRGYVLFFAAVQAAFLTKAVNEIFKSQYMLNIQDARAFETAIIETTSYKITELLINIFCHINWIYIIYHIYRSNSVIKLFNVRLPRMINTKSKLIFTSGLSLSTINNTLFGVLLWKRELTATRVVYKLTECLSYTVFGGLTVYFMISNFGFILVPKRLESNVSFSRKLILIWKDYHETIPLLIYNAVLLVFCFFETIYNTIQNYYLLRWKYNALYFFKLLVTVNFWGLINVLEKREILLNKRTVLGRKINNKDTFFVDPTVDYGRQELSTIMSKNSSNTSSNHDGIQGKESLNRIPYPIETWKSKLSRARDRRNRSKKNLVRRKCGKSSGVSERQIHINNPTFLGRVSKGCTTSRKSSVNMEVFSGRHLGSDETDNESIETELARNFIYNHDNESQ